MQRGRIEVGAVGPDQRVNQIRQEYALASPVHDVSLYHPRKEVAMADQDQKEQISENEEELFSREIPITYYGTQDVVGIIADQAMVSHSTGFFTLYFFQMQIPPTEKVEDLQKLEELPARCVARIVLTPALLRQFVEAIGKNMERYERLIERQAEKTEK